MTTLSKALLTRLGKLDALPITESPTSEFIPTGSFNLDYILGGGLGRGLMSYFYGYEWSGKTTMALLIARHIAQNADTMKNGGLVAFFDMEGGVHPQWFNRLGIDPERVHLYQPPSGEAACDAMRAMFQANAYDLIVYDSIANTPWNAELEADMDKSQMGLGARQWGRFWTSAWKELRLSNTALLMTNQLRKSMDQYAPEFEKGGLQISRFAPSVKLRFMPPKSGKNDKLAWVDFRPRDTKNRVVGVRNPKGELVVRMLTSVPVPFIDIVPELASMGKKLLVFTNKNGGEISGAAGWYFNGEPVAEGSGEPPVLERLYDDEDFRQEVQAALQQAILSQSLTATGPANVDDDEEGEGPE